MTPKKSDDSAEPTVEDTALAAEAAASDASAEAAETVSDAPEVVGEPDAAAEELVIDYDAHQEADPSAESVTPVEAPPVAEVTEAAPQTVYVTLPAAPQPRGNRGFGILIAMLATLVFGALYTGVSWFVLAAAIAAGTPFTAFFMTPLFYLPIVVFFVAMAVYALLANRAAWWSWVIGSALIAVAVYFGAIGARILLAQLMGGEPVAFLDLAVTPLLIAAAVIAREVSLWFGAIIAARGRRVKERNREARADHEREVAELRASYGQPA